jgi:hypothetical protein
MSEVPQVPAPVLAADPDHTQQCGRCRRVFDMEPDAEPGTLAEMWLCASCRVALLGRPTLVTKPRS